MLTHPVRRELDDPISFMGLEQDDWIVLAGAGYFVSAAIPELPVGVGNFNFTIGIKILLLGAVFSIWLAIRKDKPRYFLINMLESLAEPDVWVPTPDVWARPVVQVLPVSRKGGEGNGGT